MRRIFLYFSVSMTVIMSLMTIFSMLRLRRDSGGDAAAGGGSAAGGSGGVGSAGMAGFLNTFGIVYGIIGAVHLCVCWYCSCCCCLIGIGGLSSDDSDDGSGFGVVFCLSACCNCFLAVLLSAIWPVSDSLTICCILCCSTTCIMICVMYCIWSAVRKSKQAIVDIIRPIVDTKPNESEKEEIPYQYDVEKWLSPMIILLGSGEPKSGFLGNTDWKQFQGYRSMASFQFNIPTYTVVSEIEEEFYRFTYDRWSGGNWRAALEKAIRGIKHKTYPTGYNWDKIHEIIGGILRNIGENVENAIRPKFDLFDDFEIRKRVEWYAEMIMENKFENNSPHERIINYVTSQDTDGIAEAAANFGEDCLEELNVLIRRAIMAPLWIEHFKEFAGKLRVFLTTPGIQDIMRKNDFDHVAFFDRMVAQLRIELRRVFGTFSSEEDLNQRFRNLQVLFWETVSSQLHQMLLGDQKDKILEEMFLKLDVHLSKCSNVLRVFHFRKVANIVKGLVNVRLGQVLDQARKYLGDQFEFEKWKDFVKLRGEELGKIVAKYADDDACEVLGCKNHDELGKRMKDELVEFKKQTDEEIARIISEIGISEEEIAKKRMEVEEIEGEGESDEDDGTVSLSSPIDYCSKKEEVEEESDVSDEIKEIEMDEISADHQPNQPQKEEEEEKEKEEKEEEGKKSKTFTRTIKLNLKGLKFQKFEEQLDMPRFRSCLRRFVTSLIDIVFSDYSDLDLMDKKLVIARKYFWGVINKVILPIVGNFQVELTRIEQMVKLEDNIHVWKDHVDHGFNWIKFRKRAKIFIQNKCKPFYSTLGDDNKVDEEELKNGLNRVVQEFWDNVRLEISPLIGDLTLKNQEKEQVKKEKLEVLRLIFQQYEDIEIINFENLARVKEQQWEKIIDEILEKNIGPIVEDLITHSLIKFLQQVQAEFNLLKIINDKKREMEVDEHLKKLTLGLEDVNLEEGDSGQVGSLEIKLFYKVTKMLGSGAFGKVLEVQRKIDGKFFAMKLALFEVNEQKRRKQVFEIILLKKLRHPHIIGLEDVFFDDRFHYFVMEKGRAMDSLIKEGIKLGEKKVWQFLIQMCMGFNAMHRKGLIHQDAKPANILLVGKNQDIKICDLGMSKELEEENTQSEGGTLLYMSPEHLKSCSGDKTIKISEKIDCFAIGLIAYELARCGGPKELSGKFYQHPKFEVDDLLAGKLGNPISPDYSDDLVVVMKHLLLPDVNDRWNTMDCLRNPVVLRKSMELGIRYSVQEIQYDPNECFNAEFHNRFGDRVLSLLRECFTEEELDAYFVVNHDDEKNKQQQQQVKKEKNEFRRTIYFLESPPPEKSSSVCLFQRLILVDVLKLLHLNHSCKGIFMEGISEYKTPEIFRGLSSKLEGKPIFRYALLKSLFLRTVISPIEFYSFVFGRNFGIYGGEDKELLRIEQNIVMQKKEGLVSKNDIEMDMDMEGIDFSMIPDDHFEEEIEGEGGDLVMDMEKYQCSSEQELKEKIYKKRMERTFEILMDNIREKSTSSSSVYRENKKDHFDYSVFFYGTPPTMNELKILCQHNGVNLIAIRTFPVMNKRSGHIPVEMKEDNDVVRLKQQEANYSVSLKDIVINELESVFKWKGEFDEGKKAFEVDNLPVALEKFGNVMVLQPFFLDNRRFYVKAATAWERAKKVRRRQNSTMRRIENNLNALGRDANILISRQEDLEAVFDEENRDYALNKHENLNFRDQAGIKQQRVGNVDLTAQLEEIEGEVEDYGKTFQVAFNPLPPVSHID